MIDSRVELERIMNHPEFNGEFHEDGCRILIGKRGGETEKIHRWRQSGMLQTWKRDLSRFRLPIKFGLYQSAAIEDGCSNTLHAAFECEPERREKKQ